MATPDLLDFNDEINQRYAAESNNSCNLSCGSNLEFLKIKKGERILDLGCGKGTETIQAAIILGNTGWATGLDLTPEMVARAQENAAAQSLKNADFIQGNLENLPFKDCQFDAVMSNCVLNHAQDKQRAYREIYRVLKKGGRFIISDAVTKVPLPPEVKNDPVAWANCFGGAVPEVDYLQYIQSSGFKVIEVLKRREYQKNSYDFISLTIKGVKQTI